MSKLQRALQATPLQQLKDLHRQFLRACEIKHWIHPVKIFCPKLLIDRLPTRCERQGNCTGVIVDLGIVDGLVVSIYRGPASKQQRGPLLYVQTALDRSVSRYRDKLLACVTGSDPGHL